MSITPAESQVMEALWRRGPLSAEDLLAEVASQNWGEATVRTLIHRLMKRKAIQSRKIDGRIRYVPVLQRSDYLQAESQGLLDRLFGGRLTSLVAHFADQRALTPEEVKRLRALLEEISVILDEDIQSLQELHGSIKSSREEIACSTWDI